jgi:uncharacterized membrane protein YvlD (DUF360 family)
MLMRLIIRLVLSAAAFVFILPLIHGIDFHGNFGQALLLSIVFGIMLWLVDLIAVAFSAVATISSLGLALLWLIPLWLLGFWVLPAVALKVVSDLMPGSLTITGWWPAVFGGLVMLFIGMVTSGSAWKKAH